MTDIALEGIAPCGVTCFACPSYLKTCKGCRSDAPQKRTSKYNCKIRICCLESKQYQICSECDEVPCTALYKKLLKTHTDEAKYAYRRDTLEHFRLIKRIGLQKALELLDKRWTCPACGGRIRFYSYVCDACGQSFLEEMQNYHEV